MASGTSSGFSKLSLFALLLSLGCGSSGSEPANSSGGGKGGSATGGTSSGGNGGTATGGSAGASTGGSGGSTSGGTGGSSGAAPGGGGSSSGGCPGSDAGTCGNDGSSWPLASQALECQLIDFLNQRRTAGATCGSTDMPPAPEVSRNQTLTDNARTHSQDMNDRSYVDLVTPDGVGPIDWSMPGYCGTYVTAEVGSAQADPDTFLATVFNTESECKKLMAQGAKGVGVGYYTDSTGTSVHLWTLVLGSAP